MLLLAVWRQARAVSGFAQRARRSTEPGRRAHGAQGRDVQRWQGRPRHGRVPRGCPRCAMVDARHGAEVERSRWCRRRCGCCLLRHSGRPAAWWRDAQMCGLRRRLWLRLLLHGCDVAGTRSAGREFCCCAPRRHGRQRADAESRRDVGRRGRRYCCRRLGHRSSSRLCSLRVGLGQTCGRRGDAGVVGR